MEAILADKQTAQWVDSARLYDVERFERRRKGLTAEITKKGLRCGVITSAAKPRLSSISHVEISSTSSFLRSLQTGLRKYR